MQTQRKLMLVASTGGHLAELLRLHPLLAASDDSLWVTFRTPQSETLLRGRRVLYVRYIRPRDLASIVRVFIAVVLHMRTERFDAAVSTGSGIALACLPAAMIRRIPTEYIESLGRVQGPSTTGRVLQFLRRTRLLRQSGSWGEGIWEQHPSVLTTFRAVERDVHDSHPRLFVTLGTIEGFRFDALINAVLASGFADEHTVWQLGCTTRTDLPGRVYTHLSPKDYNAAARQADVVISHAGVGSLLVLLELGIYPILATRRGSRGEHVDDHQVQMADMVNGLGTGIVVDAPEVTRDLIRFARAKAIVTDESPLDSLARLAS